MQHAALMDELDGVTNLENELDSCTNRELIVVAKPIYPLSLNQFHNQIGHAVIRKAAVEVACNIGMIDRGENFCSTWNLPRTSSVSTWFENSLKAN